MFQRIIDSITTAVRPLKVFFKANRGLILSGLTIVSILLIVWARLGFTFQIGKFFAASNGADPSQCFSWDANGSPDGNFAQFNAIGNPSNVVAGGGYSTLVYRGHYTNNCDYQVHLLFNSSGGNSAGGTPVSPQDFATDSAFTRNPLDVAPHTNGTWEFTYNVNAFNCGRINANAAWRFNAFPSAPADTGVFAVVFNYGVACTGSGGGATPTPTATPSGASVLSVQCGITQNVLTWTLVSGRSANSILKGVDGAAQDWVCGGPNNIAPCTSLNVNTFTDTNVSAGHTYLYTHKAAADLTSNRVTCPSPTPTPTSTASPTPTGTATPTPSTTGSPTPTPTATTSPTPTPTVTPTPTSNGSLLVCAPTSQTVSIGQSASLQASGATGAYNWASEGQTATGAAVSFSYGSTGTKQVVVISGGQTAVCSVVVAGSSGSLGNVLALSMTGRNFSTDSAESTPVNTTPNQQVEVVMRVQNVSAALLGSVVVSAALPSGISYVAGSTTIQGTPIADGITLGGVAAGGLAPSQVAEVRFRVLISSTAFPVGTSQAILTGQAKGDGSLATDGQLSIFITRTSTSPGTVQTGPGDAVLAAFLISAVATLLYVSYTRSPSYRRREVRRISEDQGPMDFRV